MKKLCTIILILCLFLFPSFVEAATVNATDCTVAAINTAITASSTGDTITIKGGAACTATWTTAVTIPDNKKLVIQGGGKTVTVITASTIGNPVFMMGSSGSRITGIGFSGGMIYSNGNGSVIDNCDFTFSGQRNDAIIIQHRDAYPPTRPYALIHSNSFECGRVGSLGTNFTLAENNAQHLLWTEVPSLGSSTGTVYVENNTWNVTACNTALPAVDCNYSGRYVFRYNTITSSSVEANAGIYLAEAHSAGNGSRGCQSWEIYNNVVNNAGTAMFLPIRLRGGTGVIFNNSFQGNWANWALALDNYRSYHAECDGYNAAIGCCDGNNTHGWDQNSTGMTGYACRDQIGYGYDTTTWAPDSAWSQVSLPVYGWNNKRTDGTTDILLVQVINDIGNPIVSERDFYNNTQKPGYAAATCPHPLTGLTGTCTSTAGTGGYNVGSAASFGSGTGFMAGQGAGITFQ